MSMFDTPSVDNASGVDATAGAARGFTDSVSDAYDAGYKAMSQLGVGTEFARVQHEQNARIQQLTGKWPTSELDARTPPRGDPVPSRVRDPMDIARFFEHGGSPEMADAIAAHDRGIAALSAKHPELGLKSIGDQWAQVKDEAKRAEEIAQSPGSSIGSFIGDAAASFDPRVNPLNVASLAFAPFGKTIAARVGSAAGIGGISQAINEVTGVNENRRLLGLETGFGGSVERVVTTAAGAGAIQGVGEGLFAGARRLMGGRSKAPLPTPPQTVEAPVAAQPGAGATSSVLDSPTLFRSFEDFEAAVKQDVPASIYDSQANVAARNPYGSSRLGVARHEADLGTIEQQLQQINRGENLKLSTALHNPPEPLERELPHWMNPAEERVPELARQIDPELYVQVDKLEGLIQAERDKMVGARTSRDALPVGELDAKLKQADDLENQIAELRSQAAEADVDRRKAKKLNKKIEALEKEQADVIKSVSPEAEAAGAHDTQVHVSSNRIAELEHELMKLAPLRKRAENLAVNQYINEKPLRELFPDIATKLRGELRIPDSSAKPIIESRRPSEKLTKAEGGDDVTPGTQKRPGTTSGPDPEAKPNDSSGVDTMLRDLSHENAAHSSEVLAAFDAVDAVRTGHQGEVIFGGRRYKLDDAIPVEPIRDEHGEIIGVKTMTMREILKEVGDDADMLQAMRGCAL